MRKDTHFEKARRLDALQEKMDPDTEWEVIVETVYGSAMHYIAFYCEERLNRHMDTHKGLARFLDENGLDRFATLFREMDMHRQGKWYGAQGNGGTVKRVRAILQEIATECGAVG